MSFFTTFRFRVTTDLDDVSITFRVFGRELSMSLVEWTVRLGMCTLEEAISSKWRDRERGIPRRHVDFDPQAAWEELTHPTAGQFTSTQSRSIYFNNPILHLVQLYLDYNLLGQTNSAVRTSMTELYLLWCARNLSLCNILGVFVCNNIAMIETEYLSLMFIVDPPGLFDIQFFTRTNTVYIREDVPYFYAVGEAAIPPCRVNAGQGGQVQEHRKAELDRAVAEMVEENREIRNQITRLTNLMEDFFKEFIRRNQASGAGTSGQAGRVNEPQERKEEADESQESEEDASEQPETVPGATTAPGSGPRRSQCRR